jgi:hypothetical protein
MSSNNSGYTGVDMSVVSTKREKEPEKQPEGLPKPYPASAPVDYHRDYYKKYIKPKITGNKIIDATLFKYAKRAEAAGVKLPKILQGKTFQEYLKSQGMETTAKRSGGTKIKTPHIMELPTVGKRN